MIQDAAGADRSRLVLLASIGGIAHSEALAPGSVVDAAQRIGGHGVNRLQAVDELLLAGTLQAEKEAESISLGKSIEDFSTTYMGNQSVLVGNPWSALCDSIISSQ